MRPFEIASKPSGRPHALVLAPFSQEGLRLLGNQLDVTYESWMATRRIHDPDEFAAKLNDCKTVILVIELDFVFDDVFETAPALRFVGICRAATDHVDVAAATANGVAVVNTPARNAQAVAEHALGLMLALARRIPDSHRYVVEGRWVNPVGPYLEMRGVELGGKTLGIVGLGAVGQRLADLAIAVGMTCIAHDPYAASPTVAALTGLDELLARSDFVSIHAPLNSETEGMLDSRRLALMKSTAYLVNLSDAGIVDRDALAAALEGRKIAGAALDVFETHPITPDHPLLKLENVILTPHLGGATDETIERHSRMMADDVQRFLAGARPKNLVNPDVWEELR